MGSTCTETQSIAPVGKVLTFMEVIHIQKYHVTCEEIGQWMKPVQVNAIFSSEYFWQYTSGLLLMNLYSHGFQGPKYHIAKKM